MIISWVEQQIKKHIQHLYWIVIVIRDSFKCLLTPSIKIDKSKEIEGWRLSTQKDKVYQKVSDAQGVFLFRQPKFMWFHVQSCLYCCLFKCSPIVLIIIFPNDPKRTYAFLKKPQAPLYFENVKLFIKNKDYT